MNDEMEELKVFSRIINIFPGPSFCAESEVFWPMSRKFTKDGKRTKKLSVLALSAEMEKEIRFKQFCGMVKMLKLYWKPNGWK